MPHARPSNDGQLSLCTGRGPAGVDSEHGLVNSPLVYPDAHDAAVEWIEQRLSCRRPFWSEPSSRVFQPCIPRMESGKRPGAGGVGLGPKPEPEQSISRPTARCLEVLARVPSPVPRAPAMSDKIIERASGLAFVTASLFDDVAHSIGHQIARITTCSDEFANFRRRDLELCDRVNVNAPRA